MSAENLLKTPLVRMPDGSYSLGEATARLHILLTRSKYGPFEQFRIDPLIEKLWGAKISSLMPSACKFSVTRRGWALQRSSRRSISIP